MRKDFCLYLFGAPRLTRGDQTIAVDTRKALALLTYLVLGEAGPGGEYSRDSLAALLYPDSDQSSARAALRRTLSALRKALDNTYLVTNRDRVSLRTEGLWVDVLAYRDKLSGIKNHPHPPNDICEECLPPLQEAAGLYQDGFMAGFSLRDSSAFDDWQFLHGEALRQELADTLQKLSIGLAAQKNYEAAGQEARLWLSLDPLREEAHRSLMLVYAWGNQRNAALRQYRECVRILEQELGVAPLEETTLLYQSILENRIPPPPTLAPAKTDPTSQAPLSTVPGSKPDPTPAPSIPGDSVLRAGLLPFVGREVELLGLLEAHAAAGPQGFIAAIEGEAGIGKSRLAAEFITRARNQGAAIIQARCYEGETGLSYAPFLDGLDTALALPSASATLQHLPVGVISPAVQLLPGLTTFFPELPPAPPPDSAGSQVRFFDALRLILAALIQGSDQRPAGVLFMDDLQWIDAASLDLLVYLARRLRGVLILLAWRTDSVLEDHPLHHLVAQSQREGRATHLHLDRLEMQAVLKLVQAVQPDAAIPSDLMRTLYQETEGNPFFVVEYLDNLFNDPSAVENWQDREKPSLTMPTTVRNLLQAHLVTVGDLGQQLLSAAAVLGRTFDFSILRAVSGRSEMETINGLEDLLRRGMIVERAAPPQNSFTDPGGLEARYDFSHDKLRALAYEQTSLARRRLLHQRAAEAFADATRAHPEAASLAAHHFRLAGQLAQAAAAYQQAGAFARRVYANREAIVHFKNALACEHPDPATLHEAIGDLQALLGEYQPARNSYETAAALCPPGHLAWIEHKLGNIHHQLGDWELAECYFQAALDGLDNTEAPEEKAGIYTDWSRTAYRRGNNAQASNLAAKAFELAEEAENPYALAQAHNIQGILARVNNQHTQALHHLQRSLAIAESLNDPGPRVAALNNLARVYAQNDQIEQAIQLTETALALCRQLNDRHRAAALHNNLADLFHAAGEQEKAMQHLRQAVVTFAEIGEQAASPIDDQTDGLRPEIWKLSEW